MPTRTWRIGRLTVRVDLSDGKAPLAGGNDTARPGRLIFREPPPLDVKRRDAAEALAFRDVAETKGREAAAHLTADDADLVDQARELSWYHTIELPGGVTTPGQFDHRELLPHYGF